MRKKQKAASVQSTFKKSVSIFVLIVMFAIIAYAQIQRSADRLMMVNLFYLPSLKQIALMSGKWSSYRKALDQDVQFRKWGEENVEIPKPHLNLAKTIQADSQDIQVILDHVRNRFETESFLAHLKMMEDFLIQVKAVADKENFRLAELSVLVKNRRLQEAATLYMQIRTDHGMIGNDLIKLTNEFEAEANRLQNRSENFIKISAILMVALLALSLIFTFAMSLYYRKWMTPLMAWKETFASLARHITAKEWTEEGKQFQLPLTDPNMPVELRMLTDELRAVAVTALDHHRIIKQQQAKLVSQNKDLKVQIQTENKQSHVKRMELAGNLSAQVAHEVRNPLNSIMLQLDLLEEDIGTNQGAANRIHQIQEQLERLERLTDKYLGVGSRSDVQETENTDLNNLIEKTIEFLNLEIQSLNIRVELNLSKAPVWVKCNRDQLEQVILNLLRNAIDAVKHSKNAKRWIRFTTLVNGRFLIEDSGDGVNESVKDRIFEPFVTSKAHGTGLGLSLSRKICMEHGGDLKFHGGSKFEVQLPC